MALLQNPRVPYCSSPTESSSNTLQCFLPPLIPPTLQGLLDYCRTLSCSGSQWTILQCEIFAQKSNIPQREYPQKGSLNFVLPSLWNEVQNNLSFNLEKMFWKVSERCFPKIWRMCQDLSPLEHVCLIKAFSMLATSCLSALIKVMPLM